MSAKMRICPNLSRMEKATKNHLLCFLCNEKFKKPKILNCLHTYCEACLIKIRHPTRFPEENIRCPCCREVTEGRVQETKTNYFLIRLVKEAALPEVLKSNKISCSLCATTKASNHCFDCAQFLCSKCQKIHDLLLSSSEHKIMSLEECREGKVPTDLPITDGFVRCGKHCEKCQYFCQTCQELICRDCTVLDHPSQSHTYTNLNAAAVEGKTSIQSLLAQLATKLPKLENVLGLFKELDPIFKSHSKQTIAEVQAFADKIREEITAQEKQLIREIRQESHQQTKDLTLTCKGLSESVTRAKFSLEAGAVFTKKSTDSEFLWLRSIVENDLQRHVDKELPSLPKTVGFLENEDDIILGELDDEVDMKQFVQKHFQEMSSSRSGRPLRGPSQRRPKEENASRKETPKFKPEETNASNRSSEDKEENHNPSEKFASSTKPKTYAEEKPVQRQWQPESHIQASTETSKSVGKTKTVPPSDRVLRSSSKINIAEEQPMMSSGQNRQGDFGSVGGSPTISSSSLIDNQRLGGFRFTAASKSSPVENQISQNMENLPIQQQRAPSSSFNQSRRPNAELQQDEHDGENPGLNENKTSPNHDETDSDDSDL